MVAGKGGHLLLNLHRMKTLSAQHLFDIPQDIVYLIAPVYLRNLKSVTEAGNGAFSEGSPWQIKAGIGLTTRKTCGPCWPGFLNTERVGVALVPSVSYGVSIAAGPIFLTGKGQQILLLDQNIPPLLFLA